MYPKTREEKNFGNQLECWRASNINASKDPRLRTGHWIIGPELHSAYSGVSAERDQGSLSFGG